MPSKKKNIALTQNAKFFQSNKMSVPRRDMLFCVLYVGDEHLLRHLVSDSARRLGAEDHIWQNGIKNSPLTRLRVMFFLLLDRDPALKQKLLDGWGDLCVPGVETSKAGAFFHGLKAQVIEPWLIDERKSEDWFISAATDLYLVS